MNIIVPAHNEAAQIATCIVTLTRLYPEATLTIATDGNTDATAEIAKEYEIQNLNIIVTDTPTRIGKGAAIKQSLIYGATNAYTDADLAANPHALYAMNEIAEKTNGLVIARRITTNRSHTRTLTSKLYNNAVNLLFNTNIADHQCGLKALSPVATCIAANVEADGFFFDTELIVKCKKARLPIIEYPVMWTEHKTKSTVNLAKDGAKMLYYLLKLWIKCVLHLA